MLLGVICNLVMTVSPFALLLRFSRYFEIISEIVYKYGLIAELIGRIKVTDQAYTEGGSLITLACTRIPIKMTGN